MSHAPVLFEVIKRPGIYFWIHEQTVAYLGEEIGNLLDHAAAEASAHYPFVEAIGGASRDMNSKGRTLL